MKWEEFLSREKPLPRKLKKKTLIRHMYGVGERIFAIANGHPSRPAKILLQLPGRYEAYLVQFYGTKESEKVNIGQILPYDEETVESLKDPGPLPKHFELAMKEAEEDVEAGLLASKHQKTESTDSGEESSRKRKARDDDDDDEEEEEENDDNANSETSNVVPAKRSKSKNVAATVKTGVKNHSAGTSKNNPSDPSMFTKLSVLGRGILGTVYEVACKDNQKKKYAMKVLPKNYDIADEIHIALHCHSTHIVRAHFTFDDRFRTYLMFDLMKLTLWDNYDKLDSALLPNYVHQIALGIDAIHDFGFIHGDLKTPNVLISFQNKIKICDFGSAVRASVTGNDEAMVKTNRGYTFAYQAPECVQTEQEQEGRKISKKSDWWSFGCMLYEIFHPRHQDLFSHTIKKKTLDEIICTQSYFQTKIHSAFPSDPVMTKLLFIFLTDIQRRQSWFTANLPGKFQSFNQ